MAIYYFAYNEALDELGKADLDLVVDDIRALLVTADYVPAVSHTSLADVPSAARIDSGVALTSKTFTALVYDHAQITFPSVTAGKTATAVLYYKHTGVDSTARLVLYNAAVRDFPYPTNGSDIVVDPPAAGVMIFENRGEVP